MKKAFFLLTIVLISTAASAQKPVNLVYFENYAPFSWKENNQMHGILINVLNEAIQMRMGIPVSHSGYPWARAQNRVKNNKSDAFVTVPTPERKTYTEISTEPIVLATFTLFVKKGNSKIENIRTVKAISDLQKFTLGHYIGSGWAKKNLGNMNVSWTSKLDNTLTMLIKGRFEIFVDTSQVVRFTIKKLNYQGQIVELPNIVDSAPFNLCIGKESPYVNILPKFDKTLKDMKKDGKLQKIYDNYK